MDFAKMLASDHVKQTLLHAHYGIEKESHRVDLSGNLVTTDHPERITLKDDHPYIQRDFSETQVELITPVTESVEDLFNALAAIHDVAYRSMDEGEMLWPLSMPPQLPEKEDDIVIAKLEHADNVRYRETLARVYGRRKQMVNGIHFNFSFGEALIEALFREQTAYDDMQQLKTDMYLKVARNYMHYRWLVTYFYGASPQSEKNYFENDDDLHEPVRSIRGSRYGYANADEVEVSYRSIQSYVSDLASLVERRLLSEEKEFYGHVRLRGGQHVTDLEAGVDYIELRNIDLNPFERYGISEEQVEFLHLFLLYLLWKDGGEHTDDWVKLGDTYNESVALEHPLARTQLEDEAKQIVDEMAQFVAALDLPDYDKLFVNLRDMLTDPSKTLAGRLYKESEKSKQSEVATRIAKENYEKAWEKPYQLSGFTDMELSTQLLMFDAIQQGIEIEILDRHDQFLKLTLYEHVEYVKNGNMTSKDNYVSTLIMENKTVTKKILHQHGFRVPEGEEFQSIEQAIRAYHLFSNKPFVVKPKTTNYGIGISIFKDGAKEEDYVKAITLAFKEDDAVLVEEFIAGTEYRFFVLADQVLAVLLRVPANVKGDGKHTIEQLVAIKNRDPLRGEDHRTPLELIQLGEIESLMLKGQGYQLDSIPAKGEIVYLRENSNVSTGGDSIDVTDLIPDDYKKIAVDAVGALGVKISGIDLIIEDTEVPAADKNAYGIIEANFNPSMYMHVYPYQGTSRRLTMHVIQYLFPELLQR